MPGGDSTGADRMSGGRRLVPSRSPNQLSVFRVGPGLAMAAVVDSANTRSIIHRFQVGDPRLALGTGRMTRWVLQNSTTIILTAKY